MIVYRRETLELNMRDIASGKWSVVDLGLDANAPIDRLDVASCIRSLQEKLVDTGEPGRMTPRVLAYVLDQRDNPCRDVPPVVSYEDLQFKEYAGAIPFTGRTSLLRKAPITQVYWAWSGTRHVETYVSLLERYGAGVHLIVDYADVISLAPLDERVFFSGRKSIDSVSIFVTIINPLYSTTQNKFPLRPTDHQLWLCYELTSILESRFGKLRNVTASAGIGGLAMNHPYSVGEAFAHGLTAEG